MASEMLVNTGSDNGLSDGTTSASDRCQIDIDPRAFVIRDCPSASETTMKIMKILSGSTKTMIRI